MSMTTDFYNRNKDRIEALKDGEDSICLGGRNAACEIKREGGEILSRTLYRFGKPTDWAVHHKWLSYS